VQKPCPQIQCSRIWEGYTQQLSALLIAMNPLRLHLSVACGIG